MYYIIFFASLAFALRLLGFCFISSSLGRIGFLFNIFRLFLCPQLQIISSQIQSLVSSLNIFLVILSSKE